MVTTWHPLGDMGCEGRKVEDLKGEDRELLHWGWVRLVGKWCAWSIGAWIRNKIDERKTEVLV